MREIHESFEKLREFCIFTVFNQFRLQGKLARERIKCIKGEKMGELREFCVLGENFWLKRELVREKM